MVSEIKRRPSPLVARANRIVAVRDRGAIIGNDSISVGDLVVGAGNSDYSCLLGVVTSIDRLGTPEHDTENDTDDIHVDFTVFDYPPERISEIEGRFSKLYGVPKNYDDLPLDDVIMAPDELIHITNMGDRELERLANSLGYCESFCSRFPTGTEPVGKRHIPPPPARTKPVSKQAATKSKDMRRLPAQAIRLDGINRASVPSIAGRLATAAVAVEAYKGQRAQNKTNKNMDITI